MKRYLLLFSVLLSLTLTAQEDLEDFKSFKTDRTQEYNASNAVFKLSFLFPSVGGEFRLAERFSLDFSGDLDLV